MMLFLGYNDTRRRVILFSNQTIYPNQMRYDTFDNKSGKEWNDAKMRFPEIQLAEEIIHTHFLDQIDDKLIRGILPEEYAKLMVDIVVALRTELIIVAENCQLLIPLFLKELHSSRLLKLLDKLQRMDESQEVDLPAEEEFLVNTAR